MNPMPRRFGEPPRPVPHRLRPGAYGVILAPGGLLLTRDGTGEVQLPGGGMDPGESPEQGLIREVREETGWLVRPIRRLALYRRFAWIEEEDRLAEKVAHVILARAVRRLGPPTEARHTALTMGWKAAMAALGPPGEPLILSETRRRFPSTCR